MERDGKRIVISGCSQILEKSWLLGFRVWREIEQELLLVGGGHKQLEKSVFGV